MKGDNLLLLYMLNFILPHESLTFLAAVTMSLSETIILGRPEGVNAV